MPARCRHAIEEQRRGAADTACRFLCEESAAVIVAGQYSRDVCARHRVPVHAAEAPAAGRLESARLDYFGTVANS